MPEKPEKLDLRSHSISEDKKADLLRLFPEIKTEGGKVDIEKLKLTLGETVDVGKERYGMNWPGKAECFKTIQQPSMATLIPAKKESVNFDETENLIIEGDNLEVLKLLQKSYMGKIKLIYIDPPYNTGNDFIYPDNYSESLQTYLEYTGQVDGEGRKFSTNTEADGRFHSKWMNMMYPRIFLARNLLKDDGVIFISIDDHEVDNLKIICNEIFGEENFIASLIWIGGRKNDSKLISSSHEYVLCYSKNLSLINSTNSEWGERKEGLEKIYLAYEKFSKESNGDWKKVSEELQEWFKGLRPYDPAKEHEHYRWADKNGVYFASDISGPDDGRKNRPRYEVLHPITKKPVQIPSGGWRWDFERMQKELAEDRVHFGEDETSTPNIKVYLKANEFHTPSSVFYKDRRAASNALKNLFSNKVFDFPKDHEIISRLIALTTEKDDVVLDFFAGSGSTGHAVLELNKHDGKNRKFILVQLPEPTEIKEYPTIAEIAKERIRLAIKKINNEDSRQLQLGQDNKMAFGFKVFKLQSSNFKVWENDAPGDLEKLGKQLEMHVNHLVKGRTQDDILYEILLKSGYPLISKIQTLTLAGKKVYGVQDGALFICLEKPLTLEILRAMADKRPERVVCLDESFEGNDQLKTNAVQTFKSKNITFRTV